MQREDLLHDARALEHRQRELCAPHRLRRLEDGAEEVCARGAREDVGRGAELVEAVHAPPVGGVRGVPAVERLERLERGCYSLGRRLVLACMLLLALEV